MSPFGEFRPLCGDVANGRVAPFRSSAPATIGGSAWPIPGAGAFARAVYFMPENGHWEAQ